MKNFFFWRLVLNVYRDKSFEMGSVFFLHILTHTKQRLPLRLKESVRNSKQTIKKKKKSILAIVPKASHSIHIKLSQSISTDDKFLDRHYKSRNGNQRKICWNGFKMKKKKKKNLQQQRRRWRQQRWWICFCLVTYLKCNFHFQKRKRKPTLNYLRFVNTIYASASVSMRAIAEQHTESSLKTVAFVNVFVRKSKSFRSFRI